MSCFLLNNSVPKLGLGIGLPYIQKRTIKPIVLSPVIWTFPGPFVTTTVSNFLVDTGPSGTVLIDWGDGEESSTVSGLAANHTYLRSTWDVTIQTTGSNETFGLQLFGSSPSITVNWGNGLVQTITTTGNHTRTYATAGTYTVRLSGSFAANGNIRLGTTNTERSRVKATSYIPLINGLNSFSSSFFNCTSLSSVPSTIFRRNPQVTTFQGCFNGCASLNNISPDLFRYNTLATNFIFCFDGCTALSNIPADLFRYNTLATTFKNCFSNCSSLNSIPAGLFQFNTLATSFEACFNSCAALSSVPEDLFTNCITTNNFSQCFANCVKLSAVPNTLFASNTGSTTFFDTFRNCTSLTDVPSALFTNNLVVTSFQGTFRSCSSLSSVPSTLFATNTAATTFADCFLFTTLETQSYSNLLIDLASNLEQRQSNVIFHGGSSKYNEPGSTARTSLSTVKSWTFIDGGRDPATIAGSTLYTVDFIPLEVTTDGNSYSISQFGTNNPTLTCYRGTNYDFIPIDLQSEPFALRVELGNTTAPVSGAFNNNTLNGTISSTIFFTPNQSTPDTIYYQSTNNGALSGIISIKDY